jgi:TPR repeat protein
MRANTLKCLITTLLLSAFLRVPVFAVSLISEVHKDQLKLLNNKKDYSAMVTILKPIAESGDPEAQFLLGSAYYTGKGINKDTALAFQYFEKAAEQGNKDAKSYLDILYPKDEGSKQTQDGAINFEKIENSTKPLKQN